MVDYLFESEQFAFSEHAIHLLRSRYNYETHPNSEITQFILRRGKLINRWGIVLILGLVFIGGTFFYLGKTYWSVSNGQVSTIYVEQIVAPILPLLLGFYCVYSALRVGPTAKVIFKNGVVKNFPLDSAQKQGRIDDLVSYLKQSNELKHKTDIRI